MELTRRAFVASSVSAVSASRILGANDRIRLGIIGSGGRGQYLMGCANQFGGIEWVAICDAWDQRRDEAEKVSGTKVTKYGDYHKLLEDKSIDAVIVATWDNMHAPVSIDVLQSGKDVYCEKPMTSVAEQGPKLAKAVRESKRVFAVGTQQRSMPVFIEAKEKFIDSGMIGKVRLVRTVWNYNTGYLFTPPAGMETKPEGLDWNACLGWLPKRPWDPKRYFNRFAYWDFGTGGQMGGLFSHWVDVAHWYLKLSHPTSAITTSGIYQYDDGRDTPDTVNTVLNYPENVNVTFEGTLIDSREQAYLEFMGTEGRLHISRAGYEYVPKDKAAEVIRQKQGGKDELHVGNWLDCIRSRKEPNATVVHGHYGSMACHMANLADRQKVRVHWKKDWEV